VDGDSERRLSRLLASMICCAKYYSESRCVSMKCIGRSISVSGVFVDL